MITLIFAYLYLRTLKTFTETGWRPPDFDNEWAGWLVVSGILDIILLGIAYITLVVLSDSGPLIKIIIAG